MRVFANSFSITKEENINWRVLIAEGFGCLKEDQIILDPIEVTYLFLRNRVELNPGASLEGLIEEFSSRDPLFPLKLLVYTDLREKKFIVRVANIGPINFEVFERGSNPLLSESKYYIMIVPSEKSVPISALYDALEAARSNGKILALAIIDQDGDVVYYNVESTLRFEVSLRLRKIDVLSK